LLRQSSVVAASRRYVGKETDRRQEQGEDLSLVEFTSFEYQQSKRVIATDEIKREILKIGIRKLERETGVSHHTLDKVLKGEPVRRTTLAEIVKQASVLLNCDERISRTQFALCCSVTRNLRRL
jgi:hypothetical protein